MKRFIVPALAAAGILLLGAPAATTQAAPLPASPVAAPDSQVETIRHTKRHRMHQRRAARRMQYRRAYGNRGGSPNAKNPSRPGYQQQLGNTSGGPR